MHQCIKTRFHRRQFITIFNRFLMWAKVPEVSMESSIETILWSQVNNHCKDLYSNLSDWIYFMYISPQKASYLLQVFSLLGKFGFVLLNKIVKLTGHFFTVYIHEKKTSETDTKYSLTIKCMLTCNDFLKRKPTEN